MHGSDELVSLCQQSDSIDDLEEVDLEEVDVASHITNRVADAISLGAAVSTLCAAFFAW